MPATCNELIPISQSRLNLDLESLDGPTTGNVIGITGGLLACVHGPAERDITATVYVMAVPPPEWGSELLTAGGTEVDGVVTHRICADDGTYCIARLATEHYAAELFVNDFALTGAISSELSAIAAELGATLMSLPESRGPATSAAHPLRIPESCDAFDISGSPVAAEIAPMLANREVDPGSGDGPLLSYAAEARIGALWCVWSATFDGMELELIPGGGWALARQGALLPGENLEVEGADAARWTESPYREEAVIVAAEVGDDLAVLTLIDSSIEGRFSDDRVGLAKRILEAFIGVLRAA